MAGTWTTFSAPDTSTGAFNADVMILLTDGSLLFHNGYVTNLGAAKQWLRLTPDANGRYETGTWSSELNMHFGRQWFGSGVLSDGRVFVIGGEYCSDPTDGSDAVSGEIFDPQTNTWSDIVKPSAFDYVRGDCNGSVLADGRVLLGGASTTEPPSTWSKLTAIWDPNDNTWVQAGLEFGAAPAGTKEDPFEEEGWALLPDGSVLAPAVRDEPQAQRYVPSLDQWVGCTNCPVSLPILTLNGTGVYETGPLITLPNGKVLTIGGSGKTAVFTPGPNPTDMGSWTIGPVFPNDTSAGALWPTLTALDAPACLLPSGKVVVQAGTTAFDNPGYFSLSPVFLEYDPNSTATTLPNLDVQPSLPAGIYTWQSCLMVLPTGQMLCSAQSNTIFVYTPDPAAGAPDPSWKPANISVPANMVQANTYTLSGTQINGLSQAVSYGDDAGMATNYPIVRLTNAGTGNVVYLRSYNFSTMGVATGTVVPDDLQTCAIDIPANLPVGDWNLVVIANGIASDITPVHISAQDCYFILDYSTFSIGEIDTYVHATPPVNAVFNQAFSLVVEGFTPGQLGLTAANLASPPILPSIPSPFPANIQIAFDGPLIPQDPALPSTPQRFTFPFSITFLDDSLFGATASTIELNATLTAAGNTVTGSAPITLIPNPNPYILHGDQTATPSEPWYLSRDVKVFQVVATPGGTPPFGATLTTGTAQHIATTFIQDAVTNLRNDTTGTLRTEFDNIAQDETSEVLQLMPNDPGSGHPAYNFAIARVRLRDTVTASNVRVFFRIWQAQQANAGYNSITYARATNLSGQPIPVLGVQGDEIVTIPFFAEPRVTTSQQLHTQPDDFNRHDIDASAGETDYFFGCWLDINQPTDLRYPQRIVGVSADGPFNGVNPLFPIQQFMVAAHQCLIVEIAYDPDPIAPGADPSNSDKLAQRNLTFVGAPNPGHPDSRRVPQTFEIKPTQPKLPQGIMPDELMIEWKNVPKGSFADIYLPAVSAASIISAADELYTTHLLKQTDANTVRVPAAGVTYMPIPQGEGITYAGLLTLDLPDGIRKGEEFTAVIRQLTSVAGNRKTDNSRTGLSQWRRTTGTFKLTIPVSTKGLLLAQEEQNLALMKWSNRAVAKTSRWHGIMQRYLDQLAGRVTFMGGDPSKIHASGTGLQRKNPAEPHKDRIFEGKIESILYDGFNRFEYFTLKTVHGDIKRFVSRDPYIEGAVLLAWLDGLMVLIITYAHDHHMPEFIELFD